MKILHVTDLHGDKEKYQLILEAAKRSKVDVVVNSGDMLPHGMHDDQLSFINNFLNDHFSKYETVGIKHLGFLGNDDLKIYDEAFDAICFKHIGIFNIAQRILRIGEYEFIGMNWVKDYPFRLKDRCRKDREGHVFEPQLGTGLLSKLEGFEELVDWKKYSGTIPTLEEELNRLPTPKNPEKAIYIIHMPPSFMGLDSTARGKEVGSEAVYNFIQEKSPRLTLHGHIHESPEISGKWSGKIRNTHCIQPGQGDREILIYVIMDIDTLEKKRFSTWIGK
jgi:uncharacterized protein